ncbi:MAG: helix-turn-helix domain-containing protein [Tannerellaceae bacterium]|jgi:signal transduction histidine kinase/ligand-binding sensor domain-containing protein/DNA-binding response OmpR family regulator|nr:helix-turn-helix domain-containing protein [Tannerellaceae bacterium]
MKHLRRRLFSFSSGWGRLLAALCILWLKGATLFGGENCYKFGRVEANKAFANSEVRCIFRDKTGFLWFGTPSGLNRYDGYEIISSKQDLMHPEANSSNNSIENIQEAYDGKLWIETRLGYTIYDPAMEDFASNTSEIFRRYTGRDDFGGYENAMAYIDNGGNFWFVTPDDLRKYDIYKQKYFVLPQGEAGRLSKGIVRRIRQGMNRYWFLFENGLLECMEAQSNLIISSDSALCKDVRTEGRPSMGLFVDSSGDVWVYGLSANFGLARFNVTRSSWIRYTAEAEEAYRISNNLVSSVAEDSNGLIWVGTDHGGVNLIDKAGGAISVLRHNENDPHSLSQNTIRCIFADASGMMWLGTYKKGVCYYHESIYKFSRPDTKHPLPFRDINSFCETADRNLWIGTNGGGLLYYDRASDAYTEYKHSPANPNSPAGDVIVSLASDPEGKLWIGYYLAGMDCFDGKRFTHYSYNEDGLSDDNTWTLMCDRSGYLWAGTLHGGVFVWDTRTGKRVRRHNTFSSVYGIIETKTGAVIIGTQRGLYIYNSTSQEFEPYEEEIFSTIRLSRHDVNCLFEDSRSLLWIGTRTGLFVFNPYTKEVKSLSCDNGMPSDLIQSIREDEEHNLWVGTNSGLTCIRVLADDNTTGYRYNTLNYDGSEGLQGEMFNYNAALFTSQSELIFGGSQGYNIFKPSNICYNKNNPHVVITDFRIYNKSIKPLEPWDGRIILRQSITQTEEIVLKHSDKYFGFTFAALNYCMPGKSRYFYKLEGFNEQWFETARGNRRLTYTNLNPGRYTLYLKAVNNDGVESSTPVVLRIRISPPFTETIWAWIIYACIIIGGGLYAWRLANKRSERKLAYDRERIRISQQLEIDEMKLRFFTNISHEFRTPLTLIISPLEDLLKKIKEPEDKERLSIIRRNAETLLTLVSQLLDFRKLDGNGFSIRPSLGDIVIFIRQQTELFAGIMKRKEIKFEFKTEVEQLYMYFDADKMSKVIANILSNAWKFTPEGGSITVTLEADGDGQQIRITVTDTGIGIPSDELAKVFDRFYQIRREGQADDHGSGIGLHIAKEFVALHEGEIRAESAPEGGARFIVTLPVKTHQPSDSDDDSAFEAEADQNSLPKLLIVEDNRELCNLLAARFKDAYTILEAHDGSEGLETALREIPDFILSDVMMPRLDGIQMSRKLKSDIRTSHIPLILLTAKSGDDSKMEGLAAGADDYIVKPFNHEMLEIKMRNLLETRNRNRQLFNEQIRIEPSRITVNSLDKQLIRKAIDYTEANLSNPNLSVEELSRELGMSRVHLYKKLLSISGKTPIEFIRIIRLKRAAQLLRESQLSVSEIAYETGFNNLKYFRKYFRDEFGLLPSQYSRKNE